MTLQHAPSQVGTVGTIGTVTDVNGVTTARALIPAVQLVDGSGSTTGTLVGVKGLDGAAIDSLANPLVTRGVNNFVTLTTTPILAAAVYTSPAIDTGVTPSTYSTIQATISSDQATAAVGNFFQESDDGVTWYNVTGLNPITTANQGATTSVSFTGRYHRIMVTNGAVNQTTFRVAYALR